MKIVNRGYIIVKAKKPFVYWANQQEEEFVMTAQTEPNVYLIEEDFFEIEPVIKQYFKKIVNRKKKCTLIFPRNFILRNNNVLRWLDV